MLAACFELEAAQLAPSIVAVKLPEALLPLSILVSFLQEAKPTSNNIE
jgi:hypothetical protein